MILHTDDSNRTASEGSPPKYRQVIESLRPQIEGWEADHPLPSEAELCAQYGISRTTARKALAELIHEGLLYAVQGKGTFVSPAKYRMRWAQRTAGFHSDMIRLGQAVRSEVLEMGVVEAGEPVARMLQIEAGERAIRVVRRRFVNGAPYDLCTNHLSYERFEGLEEEDLTDRSLYGLLKARFGVDLAGGIRMVEANACTAEEARLLEISPGSPVLVVASQMMDAEGRVVEYGVSRGRGDRAQVEIAVTSVE
jgi:GntR family transcriptional regulator